MNLKKKIVTGLCVVGLGSIGFVQLYANSGFNQALKPNVVYTKIDSSVTNKNNRSLEELYKEPFLQVFKDYFDVNVTIDNKSFYVELISEDGLKQSEQEERQMLEEMLDTKKLSLEQYNKYLSRLEGRIQNRVERLATLKHEMVECQFHIEDMSYFVTFDANTKEVLDASFSSTKEVPIKVPSDTDYNAVATQYIQKYKLGDITSPELLKTFGDNKEYLIYQQKGDPSKKVVIDVEPVTQKVTGIRTKNIAEEVYQDHR